MAGEIFKPKRIILKGKIKELVVPGIDGAVDEQSEEQAVTGAFSRTLYADPPGAYIFVCHCGHKRRVTHSETNFRCERGGVGSNDCDIIWYRKQRPSGEVDAEGHEIMEDDTIEETLKIIDEYSGKPRTVKVPRPQFIGRKVGEMRAEEFRARAARGEANFANPTNTIVQTNIISSKQQFDARVAAEKAKENK
jgi:hypothetical protein